MAHPIKGVTPDFYLHTRVLDGSFVSMVQCDTPGHVNKEDPNEIPFCYLPHCSGTSIETDLVAESNFACVSEELARFMIWDGSAHENCPGCKRAIESRDERDRDCHAGRHDRDGITCECYQEPCAHEGDHTCDACECDAVIALHGGYGSYTLAYRVDRPIPTEIAEVVDALESYPIFDESDHTEREMQDEHEQWKDWGRDEFRKVLVKYLVTVATVGPDDGDEIVEAITDADLDGLYYTIGRDRDVYPERGSDVDFNLDAWIDAATWEECEQPRPTWCKVRSEYDMRGETLADHLVRLSCQIDGWTRIALLVRLGPLATSDDAYDRDVALDLVESLGIDRDVGKRYLSCVQIAHVDAVLA